MGREMGELASAHTEACFRLARIGPGWRNPADLGGSVARLPGAKRSNSCELMRVSEHTAHGAMQHQPQPLGALPRDVAVLWANICWRRYRLVRNPLNCGVCCDCYAHNNHCGKSAGAAGVIVRDHMFAPTTHPSGGRRLRSRICEGARGLRDMAALTPCSHTEMKPSARKNFRENC